MSIAFQNVSAGYEGKRVFERLNLTLPDTGALALMGPSGCGKTTLLRLLAGLMHPEEGEITGLAGKKIAMQFQEDRLLPWRTALDNVGDVLLRGERKYARAMLQKLEIDDVNAYPGELSGGMQRRVSLARALCYGGDVLLLDEPFKGLDSALRARVIALVRESAPLIVLATHEREEADALGARVLSLAAGGSASA